MATNKMAGNDLSQKMVALVLAVVVICHRSLCLDIHTSMKNHKLWSLLESTRSLPQISHWTDEMHSYPYWRESAIRKRQSNYPMSSSRNFGDQQESETTYDDSRYKFVSPPSEFQTEDIISPGSFPPITFDNPTDPDTFSSFVNPSPPCASRRTSSLDSLLQDIIELRQKGFSRKALLTTSLTAIYREYGTKRRESNHPTFPPNRFMPPEPRKKLRHSWESHDTKTVVLPGGNAEDAYYMDPGISAPIKPPVAGVEVVVKSSDLEDFFRQRVTISPGMSVHSALYQASQQFDEEFGYKNPLAFHLGLLEEENCHIIAENSGKKVDKIHIWIIKVFEGNKLKYSSPCLPTQKKLVLRPGNRIEVSFTKLRKPNLSEDSDIEFSTY